MKKAEIENRIAVQIRKAAEDAVLKAINEVNKAGHHFEPIDESVFEWIDPVSEMALHITCAIGVGLADSSQAKPPVDPAVQRYIARAESGDDVEAAALNMLEGDIANGGFMQLYENKGERFLEESIVILRKIGSKSALRLVEQALRLFREERSRLKQHKVFLRKIGRLDSRFWNLKESIPVLFERFRQKEHGQQAD